jgi:hypothetical protein
MIGICSTHWVHEKLVHSFGRKTRKRLLMIQKRRCEDIIKVNPKERGCRLRLDVIMAMKMTLLSFWVMMPCRLVGKYQCFGETYCLHLQG